MRTTLSISDGLLEQAKERARERGQSLGRVVDDALRGEFAREQARVADRPRVPVFHGGYGPAAGVDLTSNRAMAELLDEGTELDSRR